MKTTESRAGDVTIELAVGDVAAQADMDAVVNAAKAELRSGGGVAGALHRAAGPGLEEEGRALAPIRPGEAVVTSGHGLPNRWVIHCLGPVHGRDEPAEELLASCYLEALRRAEEREMTSVAFPRSRPALSAIPWRSPRGSRSARCCRRLRASST